MAFFAVTLRYNVSKAERQAHHGAHAAYLHDLSEQGVLLLAGPLSEENAGLLIYEAEDLDQLQKVLDNEPYIIAGVVADMNVVVWAPEKGSLAPQLAAAGRSTSDPATTAKYP